MLRDNTQVLVITFDHVRLHGNIKSIVSTARAGETRCVSCKVFVIDIALGMVLV